MLNKRGATFATIVAVIGSILIALGFAWLIAQNWHYFPSFLKVIILITLTFLAYLSGVLLKEKQYYQVAKALFVLGALLYTLSIFLISQTFHLATSIQSIAWHFLIAWAGVAFAAYLFGSYVSLIISLIQFLFWINIQFSALAGSMHKLPIRAIFAFLFLISGVFFYGLSLWHRAYQHKFARLFKWWTAFYFLAFVYMLSFQSLIPFIWEGNLELSANPIVSLFVFGLVALVTLMAGIIFSVNRSSVSKKEILFFFGTIVVLTCVICLTNLGSGLLGICNEKTCYDLADQSSCLNNAYGLYCGWNNNDNQCDHITCYDFKEKKECETNYKRLGCEWKNRSYTYTCEIKSCNSYTDQTSCENAPSRDYGSKCTWSNNQCYYQSIRTYNPEDLPEDACGNYNNNKKKCITQEKCKWNPTTRYYYRLTNRKMPGIIWAIWILINVLFILFILAVIGYGSMEKSPAIINLGIIFFVLDIITRYIGFIMDLWGYTSLAIIFITGGVILLFGGWGIERWRRKLILNTKEKNLPVTTAKLKKPKKDEILQ